jgi:hypothetical protein
MHPVDMVWMEPLGFTSTNPYELSTIYICNFTGLAILACCLEDWTGGLVPAAAGSPRLQGLSHNFQQFCLPLPTTRDCNNICINICITSFIASNCYVQYNTAE